MATDAKQDLEIPKSRAEFIRLMVKQGDRRIKKTEVEEFFEYDWTLRRFWNRYFPDKKQVTIQQLIPYVEYHGRYCDRVSYLVGKMLVRRGVIWPGYEIHRYVPLSTKPLPQRYKPKPRW